MQDGKRGSTEDVLLTPEQLAARLGVPVKTLYRWRWTGYGPQAIKVGRHLRWRPRTVEEWLGKQEAEQGSVSYLSGKIGW